MTHEFVNKIRQVLIILTQSDWSFLDISDDRNRIAQLDKFFVSKDQLANTMGYRGAGADWGGGGGGWNSWDG